jgi:tetratricopeptide (TPR) repeat protein
MKDRFGEALVLGNLGYSYVLLGLPDLGLAVLEQASTIAEAIGARQQQAYNQLNLGLAHIRSGEAQFAKGVLEHSIPELEILGDVFGQATNLTYLALALEQSGELDHAAKRFEEARGILNQIGARGYANDALSGLARCLYGQGKTDEAQEQIGNLWQDLKAQGVQGMEFSTLAYHSCAEIFFALGESKRAGDAIEAGYWDLMDRAERISDLDWLKSYLQNVLEHRTIIEMWQRLNR